jgi:hypothetical protein
MTERAPDWLRHEVVSGLQRLLLLALDGGPALDSIEGVAMAWVDACLVWPIAWDRDADTPRLRHAFRVLAAGSRRWPAPVQLRDALPPRQAPPAMPPPAVDAARVAEMQREIRAILAGLR